MSALCAWCECVWLQGKRAWNLHEAASARRSDHEFRLLVGTKISWGSFWVFCSSKAWVHAQSRTKSPLHDLEVVLSFLLMPVSGQNLKGGRQKSKDGRQARKGIVTSSLHRKVHVQV